MPIEAQTIEKIIIESIPNAIVRIEDLRGDGDHYAAYVTSSTFEGKTRIEQHQMVYDALKDIMDDELHSLALQTSIPSK